MRLGSLCHRKDLLDRDRCFEVGITYLSRCDGGASSSRDRHGAAGNGRHLGIGAGIAHGESGRARSTQREGVAS